jgi:hypothetical protein
MVGITHQRPPPGWPKGVALAFLTTAAAAVALLPRGAVEHEPHVYAVGHERGLDPEAADGGQENALGCEGESH